MAKPERSEVPAHNRPKQCNNINVASFKTGLERCWLSTFQQFSLNIVHNLSVSEMQDFFYNVTGNRFRNTVLYVRYDSIGRLAPALLTARELVSTLTCSGISFTFYAITY